MKKIVLVEDDKFLRDLIQRKLINEGYEVVTAVDGDEGFARAQEAKPDIILLDIILPGIDGFEVLRRIKDDPQIARTPVIMLTNLGSKEDIERAAAMKATDYLIKAHFTPNEIVSKVKFVLGEPVSGAPAVPAAPPVSPVPPAPAQPLAPQIPPVLPQPPTSTPPPFPPAASFK